jgi:hypothetical protein
VRLPICIVAGWLVLSLTLGSCSVSQSPSVTLPPHPTYGQAVNACQDIIAMEGGRQDPATVTEYSRCMDSADKLLNGAAS